MGEKTTANTYELYEMLGGQQKSARARRVEVNEIGSRNEIAMQLAELTKQVTLLSSKKAPTQEVCNIYGTYGHSANIFSFVYYFHAGTSLEQGNTMERYQPKPRNDPYENTYNSGQRSHPNFSQKGNNNPTFAENHNQGQNFNQNIPHNPPNNSTLEENLNAFTQLSRDNQMKNNQRLDSIEASTKRVEGQVGKIVEHMQCQEKGKLFS